MELRNGYAGASAYNEAAVPHPPERSVSKNRFTPQAVNLVNRPVSLEQWTTNYDHPLEDSLNAAGRIPDVKMTPENLAVNVPRRDAVVYKMRGGVSLPD